MTTFKQFIIEEKDDPKAISVESLIAGVKKKCPKFWDDVKTHYLNDKFLYRGISNVDSKAIFNGVRKDRQPRDISMFGHKQLNKFFSKQFGVRARSTTLFATTENSSASQYGSAYIIFPTDNVDAIWSPKSSDIFIDFFGNVDNHIWNLPKLLKIQNLEEVFKKYGLFTEQDSNWDTISSNWPEFGTFKFAFKLFVGGYGGMGTQNTLDLLKKEGLTKAKLAYAIEAYLQEFLLPKLEYTRGSIVNAMNNSAGEIMIITNSYFGLKDEDDGFEINNILKQLD